MKHAQKTKQALVASVVSMAMCCALLLGTTFAWFTDSVTNTGNEIEAGTLSIQLNGEDSGGKTLFSSNDFLWEPGRSKTARVELANTGSLWLKYTIRFSDVQVTPNAQYPYADITDVLDVYKVPKTEGVAATDLDDSTRLGTVKQLMTAGTLETPEGVLAPSGESNQSVDDKDAFTLVIKMQESAGNEYQGAAATFDVVVNATQYTYEKDGFGSNQYDAGAVYDEEETTATQVDGIEDFGELSVNTSTGTSLDEYLCRGGKYALTQDVTISNTVYFLADTVIDLQGHTLKKEYGGNLCALAENVTVEFINGKVEVLSSAKQGVVNYGDFWYQVNYYDYDQTVNLNFKGVTIQVPEDAEFAALKGYARTQEGSVTLNISGAAFAGGAVESFKDSDRVTRNYTDCTWNGTSYTG